MACMLRELIGIFHCFFYFVKKLFYIYIYLYLHLYIHTNISLNKWQTYVIAHMVANIS